MDYASADVVRHVGCCCGRPLGFAVFASGRRISELWLFSCRHHPLKWYTEMTTPCEVLASLEKRLHRLQEGCFSDFSLQASESGRAIVGVTRAMRMASPDLPRAIQLPATLAKQGRRVCLVDADGQCISSVCCLFCFCPFCSCHCVALKLRSLRIHLPRLRRFPSLNSNQRSLSLVVSFDLLSLLRV